MCISRSTIGSRPRRLARWPASRCSGTRSARGRVRRRHRGTMTWCGPRSRPVISWACGTRHPGRIWRRWHRRPICESFPIRCSQLPGSGRSIEKARTSWPGGNRSTSADRLSWCRLINASAPAGRRSMPWSQASACRRRCSCRCAVATGTIVPGFRRCRAVRPSAQGGPRPGCSARSSADPPRWWRRACMPVSRPSAMACRSCGCRVSTSRTASSRC